MSHPPNRWWLRPICWVVGHRWNYLRMKKERNLALGHISHLIATDADCHRCGAQWRDYDFHRGF